MGRVSMAEQSAHRLVLCVFWWPPMSGGLWGQPCMVNSGKGVMGGGEQQPQ